MEIGTNTESETNSPLQENNKTLTYLGLNIEYLRQFKKACSESGPLSSFCVEFLGTCSEGVCWIQQDFNTMSKTYLSDSLLLQWNMYVVLEHSGRTVL